MTDADLNAIVSLIPPRFSLSDESVTLDYLVLLICPAMNIRPADVDAAFPEIMKRFRALRNARAA